MDLRIVISSCILTEQGNYFIVSQLDELLFTDKNKKTQKYRSEVCFDTAYPQFKKNVYTFTNLEYGNKITLKIGVFNTRLISEPNETRTLLEHSLLHGTTQLTLTVKLLEALRLEGELQHEAVLYDNNTDRGRISIILRHKSHDLKAQVENDIERIEKIYFDPFENDDEIVRQKLRRVEFKLQENHDPLFKKVNFLRSAHKNVSHELAQLRKQKESYEEENQQLQKIVDKKNDVKELHIHIDLLCNTDKGQDLLKKKFALLLNKLEFERKIYHELSNHYYKLEGNHQVAKTKAGDLQTMKDTLREQEFYIKRMEDQLPMLTNLKETMNNQESIIVHLQNSIRDANKNFTKLEKQEVLYDLDKLRNQRQLLKQKEIQIRTIIQTNKGEIPRDFFERYKNDEFFQDNPIIIQKFKKRAEILLKEIEVLQNQQAELSSQPPIYRPQTADTQILKLELEQADNKAEILQEQMLAIAKNYAKQIAELKAQLHKIESQL